MKKKKLLFILGPICVVVLATSIIVVAITGKKESIVYRETTVVSGDLTVGITESGSVTIGATEQTFDLDISEFVATGSSASLTGNIWGGGDMGGAMGMGGETTQSSSTSTSERTLEIEDIYISVGQEVNEGDPVMKLTSESVTEIRDELEADVTEAQLTLEELELNQKSSRLAASQNLESNKAYGANAENEYQLALKELQDKVGEANETLTTAQGDLTEASEALVSLQTEYQAAQTALTEAEKMVEAVDKSADIYSFVTSENLRDDAKATVESLESEVESKTEEIEKLQSSVTAAKTSLSEATYNLNKGAKEAQADYESRVLANNSSGEIYSVAVGYLDLDLAEAQDDYNSAKEKLDTFDSYIVNDELIAEYSGVITEVPVEVGDTLNNSSSVMSLYDWADVTVTVDISEEDMEEVSEESELNIVFDAFPDTVFTGSVTEIGDAETDSSTSEVTYPVTVTVGGDVSGLYEGMTGDVTVITKETEAVLYVSNRAITRTGTHSYVKVKDTNGDIVSKEVTTGFSDGINVEILEGLSEGDVVLIESKVSE